MYDPEMRKDCPMRGSIGNCSPVGGFCMDAVSDEICESVHNAYGHGFYNALKTLKEQETGWISVKDRLPDRQDPVLVYVPPYTDENDEYVGYVGMAYYTSFGEGFWAGTDGNIYGAIGIIHEPTHWMPLPAPPKNRR